MSTLRTNTLSNVAGTASTAIENAINGSAKAWVNFNGTGTVAIRASHNVSSITDNGTGDYTVNFTTAMADANYAVSCIVPSFSTTNTSGLALISGSSYSPVLMSTTQLRVISGNPASGANLDASVYAVTVHR